MRIFQASNMGSVDMHCPVVIRTSKYLCVAKSRIMQAFQGRHECTKSL